MPVLAQPEYTRAAIADVLAQTVPTRLLLINQGVDDAFRLELERTAEADERICLWSHVPSLPSLAATWNRALDFVWAVGGEKALVINNDLRMLAGTLGCLSEILTNTGALFISCVGVTEAQYLEAQVRYYTEPRIVIDDDQRGGPDFSCFLISRACHDRFRFDEGFTPAFCEDLDYHRRLLLVGEGARIFSVNLPYLHYGSATIKSVDSKQRQVIERAIEQGSRAYYARKWGGPVNHETYRTPFDATSADDHATTPDLHAQVRQAAGV